MRKNEVNSFSEFYKFLSHVLRNFIEEVTVSASALTWLEFLSHVLRNFIEDPDNALGGHKPESFLSHVLRNFIEEPCASDALRVQCYS